MTESVVVIGDRQPVWGDPASGTTVLAGAELQTIPSLTPDEAIRVVSGFSLFRRSSSRASNPTTHGVTMRGLSASGASRGLVLLDGVPLNDGFGGWVTWTRVPPAAISRVEIERGAKADALGSDALGGVIRFVSIGGSERSVLLSAETGSHATTTVDGAAGGRAGRASLFGAASWLRTDGVVPVAPESRGAIDQKAEADWFNGFGRIGFAGRRTAVDRQRVGRARRSRQRHHRSTQQDGWRHGRRRVRNSRPSDDVRHARVRQPEQLLSDVQLAVARAATPKH